MLDNLDTPIAFILIMLVVSLLITIAVQMVSSALNLRGLNLAQGLKRTFAVIVPSSIDPVSEENAKQLANFILKGRFLSDSFLPNWGIFKLWRHGQATRPEEVFDAIHRIAIGKEPVGRDATLRESTRKLLIALGVDKKTIDDAANKIGAVQQGTKQLTDVVSTLLPEADQTKVQGAIWTDSVRYYFKQNKEGGGSVVYKLSDQEIANLQAKDYRVIDGGVEVDQPRFIAFTPLSAASNDVAARH